MRVSLTMDSYAFLLLLLLFSRQELQTIPFFLLLLIQRRTSIRADANHNVQWYKNRKNLERANPLRNPLARVQRNQHWKENQQKFKKNQLQNQLVQ